MFELVFVPEFLYCSSEKLVITQGGKARFGIAACSKGKELSRKKYFTVSEYRTAISVWRNTFNMCYSRTEFSKALKIPFKHTFQFCLVTKAVAVLSSFFQSRSQHWSLRLWFCSLASFSAPFSSLSVEPAKIPHLLWDAGRIFHLHHILLEHIWAVALLGQLVEWFPALLPLTLLTQLFSTYLCQGIWCKWWQKFLFHWKKLSSISVTDFIAVLKSCFWRVTIFHLFQWDYKTSCTDKEETSGSQPGGCAHFQLRQAAWGW